MKIGIIASDRNEWHVKQLMEALNSKEIEAYVFPATNFQSKIGVKPQISVKGYDIDDYDALIVRKIPGGTAEQIFYRMDVFHVLEDNGIYVINPSSGIEKAVDKYYTSALLQRAGIKTPKTFVTERFDEAMKAFEILGEDVVVKPLFGSLGKGMTRISDPDVAYRVFRALEMTKSVYYIQEFIPHGKEDIRAFVIGEKVVASMIRRAENWKTNISSGGSAEPYVINEEIEKLCIKTTDIIGLDYSGVDLLKSKIDDKMYVIELNSTPGWQGIQTVTDKKIVELIIDFILGKLG